MPHFKAYSISRASLIWFVGILALAAAAIVWIDADLAAFYGFQFGAPFHVWSIRATDLGRAEYYYMLFAFGLGWTRASRKHLEKSASSDPDRIRSRSRLDSRMAALLSGLLGLFLTGVVVQVLKHAVGRVRPYADLEKSATLFHPFTANYEFHSMPSGHAQVVFSFAAFLVFMFTLRYQPQPTPLSKWVRAVVPGAILVVAAILTFTRVSTLNHWFSDVLVGAALGYFGTKAVMDWVMPKILSRLAKSVVALSADHRGPVT